MRANSSPIERRRLIFGTVGGFASGFASGATGAQHPGEADPTFVGPVGE